MPINSENAKGKAGRAAAMPSSSFFPADRSHSIGAACIIVYTHITVDMMNRASVASGAPFCASIVSKSIDIMGSGNHGRTI